MKAGDKKRRKTWKGRTVYWDTCVVLSWIKNEQRKPGHMEGVEEAVREIAKGEIGLITSVLTRAEVWDTKLNSTQKNRLDKLFRRTNVAYVPLDFAIAELTSELRDFYHASDFELLLPDAIHLATAIHLDAIEFQTFDGVNTRPPKDPEKSKAGLLNLDESVAGRTLKIRLPNAQQLNLLTGLPSPDEETTGPSAAELPGSGNGHPEGPATPKEGAETEAEDGKEES